MAASADAIRAGEAVVTLNADDRLFNRTLARTEARFKAFGRSLAAVRSQAMTVAAGTAAIGVGLAKPITLFRNFDDVMLAVKAKTQATSAEFEMLREQALALGKTMGFSATEIGKLMVELGTAGFGAGEVNKMTESVLNLARATSRAPDQAAVLLGTMTKQFGLSADAAAKLADQIVAADSKSAVTVESLIETFSYLGPVANQLGATTDEMLAMVGVLGTMGIKGSEAGTALRRLQLLATAESAKMEKLFGFSGVTAAGQIRPLIDVFEDLQKSLATMTPAEQIAKLSDAFGVLGVTSASALAKATGSVRDLHKGILDSEGLNKRMADEMRSGIGGSLDMLKGSAEGAGIAVGEVLAPALGVVGALMREAFDGVARWIKENKELAITIGSVTVGLLALTATGVGVIALGFAFTALSAPIMLAVAGVNLLVAGAGLLLSPLGLVAAAVAGLAVAFVRFTNRGRRLGAEMVAVFRQIGAVADQTFRGIAAAVGRGNIELAFRIGAAGIEQVWLTLLKRLRDWWDDFVLGVRVGFLDAMLAVIDALNQAHAAINNTDTRVATQVAQTRNRFIEERKPVRDEVIANDQRSTRDLQKLNTILARDPLGIAEGAAIEALKKNVKLRDEENSRLKAQLAASDKAEQRAVARVKAGGNFIDPTPFEDAKKDMRKETAAGLAELERKRADAERRLKELTDLAGGPDLQALLGAGVNIADLVQFGQAQTPVAPMPHRAGMRPAEERFGDAVKGLFQSADFRGSLSIGPANDMAGKQLDATKGITEVLKNEIKPVLEAIERKTEPACFA